MMNDVIEALRGQRGGAGNEQEWNTPGGKILDSVFWRQSNEVEVVNDSGTAIPAYAVVQLVPKTTGNIVVWEIQKPEAAGLRSLACTMTRMADKARGTALIGGLMVAECKPHGDLDPAPGCFAVNTKDSFLLLRRPMGNWHVRFVLDSIPLMPTPASGNKIVAVVPTYGGWI